MQTRRLENDRGAASVEYGLVIVAIAAVLAAVLFAFGAKTSELFGESCDRIQQTAALSGSCD